jgi:hypothetical protein
VTVALEQVSGDTTKQATLEGDGGIFEKIRYDYRKPVIQCHTALTDDADCCG